MMLDKSAFEKALQEDKSKTSNVPARQQSNVQFNNFSNKPAMQNSNVSRREQLWEEKKRQRANKINPAIAAPGPVMKNRVFGNNNFDGPSPITQSRAPVYQPLAPVNQFQGPPQHDFNRPGEIPEFHPIPQMQETPKQPIYFEEIQREENPQKMYYGGQNNDNIPMSVPSGQPAQMSYPQQMNRQENSGFEQPSQSVTKPDTQEKKKKNQAFLNDWKKEMEEKEQKKKREREEEKRKEREEMEKYSNPFGRGGAGAPNRDEYGRVITNRKPVPQNDHVPQVQSYQNNQNDYAQQNDFNQYNYNQPIQIQQKMPTIQYQPPVQAIPQQMNYNQGYQPMYGGPSYPQSYQMGSGLAENPYEFEPPVAPHGQDGFNHNFPRPRGMTPPVQPSSNFRGQPSANLSMEVDAPRLGRGATPSGTDERRQAQKNQWQKELLEQMEEK
jgi:hypothetical protein